MSNSSCGRPEKASTPRFADARPVGTNALLEDIAAPVPALHDTCEALIRLLTEHRYDDGAVIFGHAKDGNLHFMLTERFDLPESMQRYQRFTDDLVDLVLSHGGTLKAEHGTGRIMAPFVERQYGTELYQVMRQVKGLVDPHRVLNPDASSAMAPPATSGTSRSSPRSKLRSTAVWSVATARRSARPRT